MDGYFQMSWVVVVVVFHVWPPERERERERKMDRSHRLRLFISLQAESGAGDVRRMGEGMGEARGGKDAYRFSPHERHACFQQPLIK